MRVRDILIGACIGVGVSATFFIFRTKRVAKSLMEFKDTCNIDSTFLYNSIGKLVDLGYLDRSDWDDIYNSTKEEVFKDLIIKYGEDIGRDRYYKLFGIKPQNLA